MFYMGASKPYLAFGVAGVAGKCKELMYRKV